MNIYEQLAKVQQELKAPKDMRNNFGNYNYRSCESILEAVKPLLGKNNLALTLTDEMIPIGNRIYVKATATVFPTNSPDGNGSVSVSAFAREEESKKGMDSSQVTGAASSYARKYALNGLFCIDDNKDSDATNDHGKGEEKSQSKPKYNIDDVLKSAGGTDYYICEACGNPNYPFTKKDGSIMSAKEMLNMSQRDFKKALCKDCYKRALSESKAK